MTMPIDLVLVRHGESEGNLAKDRAKAGAIDGFTEAFRDRHSSQFRLTTRGITQAKAAGDWLKTNGLARFDRYYASEYVRAYETAGHLGLKLLAGQRWFLDFFLRERDYGHFDVMPYAERAERFPEEVKRKDRDGFFWAPPGGESMASAAMRLGRLLDTLHRECIDKRVIVVCHGETMWAMRVRLERMLATRYNALDASKHARDRIHNCQILHYTRMNPETGTMEGRYDWMRSVCPWDEALSSNAWTRIGRPTFTNEDLLAMADAEPRLIDND
jgi:NAD+ kinase